MDIYLHSLGDSFLENIIAVSIPMLIIYFMLSKGVSIAKKYAGTIGEAVQSFAQKSIGAAAGVGLGIATGGAALGMRGGAALLGQGAKKFGLTNWAAANAENSSLARWTNKSLNKMQTSSFDIRNAGLKIGGKEYTAGNAMSKGFGLFGEKLNYGLADGVGLGQKDYLGGNVKIRQDRDKRKVENIDKEINFDQLTDDEAKAVAEKKIVALAKKKAEADWKENVDVDDIVQNSQAFKNLKQKELQLEADLARSKASGSSGGQQVAQQALAQNKVAQDNVKKQITDTKANDANAFQAMKLQTVDDLKKNGEYKNSKAYSDVTNDERTRFTQEYGEIKDVKTLTSFSRSEYAKNLRNNSFWMKDGKPRWGLSTGGGLAAGDMTATLAGIGGLTTMIDAGIGAIFGAHIKEVQNSFDRASETVANRHGKTIKGNNLATHEEQLKILNKKLKKELEDNGTLMDADKASAKEIEDAIIAGIARRNKLIKLLEKKEREGAVLTDDEERNLARHQKELSDLKRMESERSNHIDKIDSIKNARKKADDAKNKPQGGDDQKKES